NQRRPLDFFRADFLEGPDGCVHQAMRLSEESSSGSIRGFLRQVRFSRWPCRCRLGNRNRSRHPEIDDFYRRVRQAEPECALVFLVERLLERSEISFLNVAVWKRQRQL